MILNKAFKQLPKILTYNLFNKAYINTQIIKQYQKQIQKASSNSINRYPKTFQEKMMVLNDPKTIHYLQIVQFGVKYKQGKNWLPIVLVALAFIGYLFTKILPIRVNQRYFMICPQSPTYFSGYLFSGFNYQKPFYLYIPLMFGVYQLSRFINLGHLALLLLGNCIVGDVLGQFLVNKRVSQYEVWENQRICFGQGNMLSILYAFWSYIGFKDAFTHLKSKLFLKTVIGQGIVRRGIPFGYLCVIYSLLQIFFYIKGSKNGQVVLAEVCTGIFMGLILRKFKPLLK